jgi:hypothetical protein
MKNIKPKDPLTSEELVRFVRLDERKKTLMEVRESLRCLLKSHYAIKKLESDDALGREMFGDASPCIEYYLEGIDIQIEGLERELG